MLKVELVFTDSKMSNVSYHKIQFQVKCITYLDDEVLQTRDQVPFMYFVAGLIFVI